LPSNQFERKQKQTKQTQSVIKKSKVNPHCDGNETVIILEAERDRERGTEIAKWDGITMNGAFWIYSDSKSNGNGIRCRSTYH